MKHFILLGLFFLSQTLLSQEVSRSVISNGGAHSTTNNVSFSSSLGQSVIQTLDGNSIYLTQGFQQIDSKGIVGISEASIQSAYQIFPNPNTGFFTVDVEADNVFDIRLELRDPLGRLIQARESYDTDRHRIQFDLDITNQGMYLLECKTVQQELIFNQLLIINK